MKKVVWINLLIFGLLPYNVFASPMYHVWGSINQKELFNETGDSPLGRSASNEFCSISASSNSTSPNGCFDVFFCSASALLQFEYWGTQWADSRAEIFVPFTGTGFEIHLGQCGVYEPPYGGYWKVEITDLMTNTKKWIHDSLGGNLDGIYEINPSHSYQLYIYSGTTTREYNGAQAEVYFSVIPEPASLLLLALGGLLIQRKAGKKQGVAP